MVTFPTQQAPPPATLPLLLALDALEHGFALLDRAGNVLHASPAFTRALGRPELAGLGHEVGRFNAALWGHANVRGLGERVEPLEIRSVRTAAGECRLQGAYVGADLFGAGPSVLVGVQTPPDDPSSPERLSERFGLTRSQTRVARLLAEGLRNDEIARRLFISAHTARHHVEQVKRKVGGHTRAALAARILQPDG
ncbi:MAG TPA: LuxR C-terminal-related transcriptional regulator [Longimicrobium sp.]|jgi:DNA-binding CsgD family transcriptional regulator